VRILFSYENLLPTSQADAEVFLNTAGAIARRGHEAALLVPSRHRADPALSADSILSYYDIDSPLPIAFLPTRTKNIVVQHLGHALRVARDPRAGCADVVYTRNLGVLTACLANGLPTAFEHYRPWGDQFPPLQALLRHVMGHPRFVGMVVHSRYSMSAYRRIGIPRESLCVIHNGFEPRRVEPRLPKWEARRRLDLPTERKIVVYSGRVNEKKGLDVALDMARARPEVLFVLVGSEGRGPIEDKAGALGNVKIVPWQPYAAIAPYLYAADVLLLPPSKAPLWRYGNTVLPLKVFLYLAAGRAILGPSNPDLHELLADGENAVLVAPGDLSAALAGLDRLCSDEALAARLGLRARELGESLTWDARAARIEAFLERRLTARRSPLEPWDVGSCLVESGAWIRDAIVRGKWIHEPGATDGSGDEAVRAWSS
jgi:glycosyltransferase involved in cell wall biosynthesis